MLATHAHVVGVPLKFVLRRIRDTRASSATGCSPMKSEARATSQPDPESSFSEGDVVALARHAERPGAGGYVFDAGLKKESPPYEGFLPAGAPSFRTSWCRRSSYSTQLVATQRLTV